MISRRGRSGQVAGCLSLLLLAITLSACAGRNDHLADTAPCPTLRNNAVRATVHRVALPGAANLRKVVPAVSHLNRSSTVHRLAAGLCALPGVDPHGQQMLCQALLRYKVTFYDRHRPLATATIPTSCQPLTGLGPKRSVPPRTWTLLGDALGIPHATAHTFQH